MQRVSLQRGLPIPDEVTARQHCLFEGVDAPELEYLRFRGIGLAPAKSNTVRVTESTSWHCCHTNLVLSHLRPRAVPYRHDDRCDEMAGVLRYTGKSS